MNINEIFGRRLGEIRYRKHLSQRQLAELIGVSGTAISDYEAGRYHPTLERLLQRANVLDVTMDYLVNTESQIAEQNKRLRVKQYVKRITGSKGQCPKCKGTVYYSENIWDRNLFCHHCGAKMNEEETK